MIAILPRPMVVNIAWRDWSIALITWKTASPDKAAILLWHAIALPGGALYSAAVLAVLVLYGDNKSHDCDVMKRLYL